jgi:hypothetical protein
MVVVVMSMLVSTLNDNYRTCGGPRGFAQLVWAVAVAMRRPPSTALIDNVRGSIRISV